MSHLQPTLGMQEYDSGSTLGMQEYDSGSTGHCCLSFPNISKYLWSRETRPATSFITALGQVDLGAFFYEGPLI